MAAKDVFEFNRLTWPEMNDAIALEKVEPRQDQHRLPVQREVRW